MRKPGHGGWGRALALAGVLGIAMGAALAATAPAPTKTNTPPRTPEAPAIEWPEWLFPIDPNSIHPPKDPPPLDDKEALTLPHSKESMTAARIGDRYNAPDWHPEDHGPMPDIVAKGRKPDIMACAFCHTPTGQGRPENAPLAGLPEAYIAEQLRDWRSGARHSAGPPEYLPSATMVKIAKAMTEAEIDESAKYFSQQKLRRHVWIIESLRIPRAEPAAWIYQEVGGTEDLEKRMLEVTNALDRHERRDDRLEYTAYVPPGALLRGKRLVTTGDEKTQKCATCHGANLKGIDKVPQLAGHSPSYLLRQLLAFKHGLRTNEPGKLMGPVVEKLEVEDMIDIVAYLSSLYP